jgi:hypothetical protein
MDPTDHDTMTRGEPPDTDCALIDAAVEALVAENRSKAMRLDAISEFHARRVAEVEAGGREGPGYFLLTPLQSTKAEFGPALAMSEMFIQGDLDMTDDLKLWFPRLWSQCLEGRLDISRARLAQAQLGYLTSAEDKAAYARRVEEYVDRQDDPGSRIHPVGYTSLQRAVRRACLRFPQKTKQETFHEAFAKRSVRMRADETTGMAALTCSAVVTDALRADYRLTLIARKRAEVAGEERTIEQLRADTLIDLVMGRLAVGAADGDLEDGADGDDPTASFESHAVGKFARPIINVTVPITTLMGLDDTPGLQAGGIHVPAEVVRRISGEPGATWYRLLTDPSGGFLELSTEGYEPTEAIWRWKVAENPQCIWPTCQRPATVIDIDHRVPYPDGPTSTRNLQPLCEHHHKVKHSQGFRVVREDDGSFTWTSRFGVRSRKPAPEYPGTERSRPSTSERSGLSTMERHLADLVWAA